MASDAKFRIITEIWLSTSPGSVLLKSISLSQTVDTKQEANLWSDRSLHRKKRYLCFSFEDLKRYNPETAILVNLTLLNDGDNPPPDHDALRNTKDTGEVALKKKILYVRFQRVDSAKEAIVDIVVTHGSSYKPSYHLVGKSKSCYIWYKKMPVPMPSSMPSLPARGDASAWSSASTRTLERTESNPDSIPIHRSAIKRGSVHPLSGIPFEINKKYASNSSDETENAFLFISSKTPEQLDNEFRYSFSLERSVLQM